MKLKSVTPRIGLPGGLVQLQLEDVQSLQGLRVKIGGVIAEIQSGSSRGLSVRIPEADEDGIVVEGNGRSRASFTLGRVWASELHPVTNPVVDALGNVYVTYSGSRGEEVPFSVFVVHPDGSKHPFLAEITNPTGLAIGPDEALYITSRHSGAVYRSTFDKQVEKFVDGLGLATGLAFDSNGTLYVGDRGGVIFRVDRQGLVSRHCELEPSISAFHLAVDPHDFLFVTGPTLATQDSIYRISPQGEVEILFKGLGRPQGLGFDPRGRLQVAASYRGRKGLFTFRDGFPEQTVSGPMLVGMAYDREGKFLYLVDSSTLYRVSLVS